MNELQKIDPFVESVNNMLVVAFPKSTSKNFSFALSLAESASKFATVEINGKNMNVAVFSMSPSDSGKAKLLLNYTGSWKGTMVFQGGRLISGNSSTYEIEKVIDCYTQAESCRDKKAHCNSIITNWDLKEEYLFPCKLISYYFKPQYEHPSSIQDQIHALAVSHNCHWCPNFTPDTFKEIKHKACEKEVKSPPILQIGSHKWFK
jgi:hypothetical protein